MNTIFKNMRRIWPLIFLPILCTVIAFVYPEKNTNKRAFEDYKLGVNPNGETLAPWDDPKEKFAEEWIFLEMNFSVDLPVMNYDEVRQVQVPSGGFFKHDMQIVFEEEIDRTAFREHFFYPEDFQKSMHMAQSRLRDYAAEQGWVWSEKSKGPTAPRQIRCMRIH